ncbi:MAG: hypothetical protein CMO19_00695 [Thaumarchaeota archaeon]|nr:hypothetical protein [Nitrososphaerota archaeon]|tara:strand:+ start:3098 stop:3397 length:300 start_codon:yes stop_codon:yes gene_type:complete
MSLEKLTEKLLYNSIVEVWIALCNDNNTEWNDIQLFNSYVNFLKSNDFEIKSLGVCPTGSGLKEEYEKKISIIFGNPNASFVIKTTPDTVKKISKFLNI